MQNLICQAAILDVFPFAFSASRFFPNILFPDLPAYRHCFLVGGRRQYIDSGFERDLCILAMTNDDPLPLTSGTPLKWVES